MSDRSPAEEFLRRLDLVTERIHRHVATPPPAALTDPEPRTGERWDWGQVWAHTAEFPTYWMNQVRLALAVPGPEQVPLGRVASDPDRVAAIESGRTVPVPELWERLSGDLAELRRLIQELRPADWAREGVHSTLGVLDMPRIFEEFLVGHLEAHADQLDELLAEANPTPG